MIRGTRNEGISSQSKQRVTGVVLTATGVKGESFELVEGDRDEDVGVDFGVTERRDIDNRLDLQSTTPSNAFNGTFE